MTQSVLTLPRILAVALSLALAALLIPAAAGAAQRWAEPGGNGPAATCPQADPCSLDAAVEDGSVVDGDEVIVKPGTYDVAAIDVADAIDLHGQALAGRPTINTTGTYGLTVSDAATVRRLEVNASGSTAVAVFGGNPTLEQISASTTSAGGVACVVLASATVRDTLCRGSVTNTRGIGANAGVGPGDRLIRLRNVTAIGTTAGMDFGFTGSGVNVDVDARNVIADGDNDVMAGAQGGATTAINLEHSNYAVATTYGTGASVTDAGTGTNQTDPPLFVDAAGGDFHQLPASPTVDAGALDDFTGNGDVDGDSRSLEGDGECPVLPDIGADEYPGSGPIDCEAPDTSIESGPEGVTSDPTPTFGFGSTEAGSTYECSLDEGPFAPCSSPHTTPSLADGRHSLAVRATDGSGNTDQSPVERSFTVARTAEPPADVDPPDTTITSGRKPRLKTRRKHVKVTFAFTSDEAGTFACSLDGKAFTPCASPLTIKVRPGRHVLSVRATDRAGNADRSPATASFKVKRKRPRR